MDNIIKNAIQNFLFSRVDIFGDECKFQDFEEEPLPGSHDGFNSLPISGRVIYRDKSGNVHKSDSVILKIMPEIKNSKFVSFSFINEMNFYTKIIPALGTLDQSFASFFPRYLHGEMIFNVSGDQTVIILENVIPRGFQMAEKKSFLDMNHLTLMMRQLGRFHAYSYQAKRKIPKLFYPLANAHLETNLFGNREIRNTLQYTAERGLKCLQQDPAYESVAKNIEALLPECEDFFLKTISNDGNPNVVLCHGDYLRNNVLFRYENDVPVEMIFIDMATYRLASPVVDLATILYLNTDQETRNKHWDELIDEYYTALQTTFQNNSIPSKDEILSEFRDKIFYGYLVASYFLPSLTAMDNGTSIYVELIPPELQKCGLHELPVNILIQACLEEGGELGTKALGDVLKDMIDRGFIGK